MELNNYRLLKIPFVSKKKLAEIFGRSKGNNKYSFSGFAYYLIDSEKNCIVWERAFFKEAEYRPTDPDMKKRTYYANIFVKKGLDRIELLGYSEENNNVKTANQEMIRKINNFLLKNVRTVLGAEGILSGSNPKGSDSQFKDSPLVIDPRVETEYVRFQNAIKRVRCKDKVLENALSSVLHEVKDIEKIFTKTITIEEFCSLNETFGKWMKIQNSDILNLSDAEDSIKEYLNEVDQTYLKESVEHAMSMFKHNLIQEDKLISKLRREFRNALLKEATENGYGEYTGLNDISVFDSEAAHILGVKEIKENNLDYKWIANPNNGLMLNPNTHTILDKKKITLTVEGTFIAVSKDYEGKELPSLEEELLNEERIMFINKRNEFL